MVESEQQAQWRRDARALVDLGDELAQTILAPVEVRIGTSTAEMAVAAWKRGDDQGLLGTEDFEQHVVRYRAAALALIGLALSERGRWEADAVYVELSPDLIGVAMEWADLGLRLNP